MCKETRELQNIISMQEQINFEPLSLTPQTPSIWLHDTDGNLQELGEETPLLLSPVSDSQDLLSLISDGETVDLDVASINHQNQLHRDDCEHVSSAETQINNSDYSSLNLETPAEGDDDSLSCCEGKHLPPDQEMVRRLSQEVELLTSQNEALNQRNQEMLNQLTEADREIERLKVELSSRYTEAHHLPEVEQLGQTRVEDLERELSTRDQQLLEAQTLITSLEEKLLQLNVPTETEETGQENKGYLLRCFEATEAKLTELERQLHQSELTCRELQMQNADLKEAEKLYRQTAEEAEVDIRRLKQEVEEKLKDGGSNRCVSGEEKIQQVIEGMVMRLKALEKLLEVIEKLDFGLREDEEKTMESELKWEEEFWSLLHNKLNPSEEKVVEKLLSEVTERMIEEKQMLLLGYCLLSKKCTDEGREGLKDLDIIWNIESETENEKIDGRRIFDLRKMEHFREVTQMKISFLNFLASSADTSVLDKLQLTADFHFSEDPWSRFIHSAATEALYCCHLSRLQSKYERKLEETKLLASSFICSKCVNLMEENRELRARLSHLEEQQSSSLGDKIDRCCQTEETRDVELQTADASIEEEEEMVESLEIPLSCVEGQLGIQEIADENTEESDAFPEETDALGSETEQVLVLKRKVEELEERVAVMAEEMKEEFDGKMSFVRTQHEKEMDKLKVGRAGGVR